MSSRDDFRYSFSGADCRATAYFPLSQSAKQFKAALNELNIALYGFPGSPSVSPAPGATADLHQDWNKGLTNRADTISAKRVNNDKLLSRLQDFHATLIDPAQTSDASTPIGIKRAADYVSSNITPALQTDARLHKELKALMAEIEAAKAKYRSAIGSITGQNVPLDSLATISFSVHEPKAIVRSLGNRTMRGLTRSVRTIAGSMIFVVVDQHPLQDIMKQDPAKDSRAIDLHKARKNYAGFRNWSQDWESGLGALSKSEEGTWRRPAGMISPFNLLLNYKSEYQQMEKGRWWEMEKGQSQPNLTLHLKNVEFVDEGFVTSVNDMVSEVVVQFIASDYSMLSTNADDESVINLLQKQAQDNSNLSNDDMQKILEGFK
jgi:hypothetical protein